MRDMRNWQMYRNILYFACDQYRDDVIREVNAISFDGDFGFQTVAAVQSYLVSEGQSNPPGPVALGAYIDAVSE